MNMHEYANWEHLPDDLVIPTTCKYTKIHHSSNTELTSIQRPQANRTIWTIAAFWSDFTA